MCIRDRVKTALAGEPGVLWVEQAEQLGTGHALAQALPLLDDAGVTLVLYGDVPLTRRETLQPLVDQARQGKLALLTVKLADPSGYGRIVRNEQNQVQRIVEEKDATLAERGSVSYTHLDVYKRQKCGSFCNGTRPTSSRMARRRAASMGAEPIRRWSMTATASSFTR